MIMDIYSRKVVAWEVHPMESAQLASILVQKAVLSEDCLLEPPVLHADNGGPQKGFTMKAKLEALGITPSYNRPRVSNDNPYSELSIARNTRSKALRLSMLPESGSVTS